jgi:CDP-diacylglycerol--serine O-phosphatidyltransferase
MVCGACDMLDGPIARLAKRTDREKVYGIQLDALADIVSFGALPAVIAYGIMLNHPAQNSGQLRTIIGIAVLSLYVLAALTRLAYFNVVEMELNNKNEKRRYYEGLPVTTVALIIPIVYVVCVHFNFLFSAVYNKMLLLISVAFVLKIRIPKPRLRYLIGLCFLIGLPIVISIILSSSRGIQ